MLAAGLCAAAWAAWFVAPRSGYPLMQAAFASGIALGALAWSAFIALALWVLMGRTGPNPWAAAVWFAPASLLLAQFSPAGIAAGVVLALGASRLLCARWEPAAADVAPAPDGILSAGTLAIETTPRWFLAAMAASLGLQAAAAMAVMGRLSRAGALAAMGIALLSAAAMGRGAWGQRRPPDARQSWTLMGYTALAALLLASLMGGGGDGTGGSGAGSAAAAVAARKQGISPVSKTRPAPAPTANLGLPGSYPGVILWPEIKPVTMLVTPLPDKRGMFESHYLPLSIPFGGEYWMFRFPFHRPPPHSFFRRGTPVNLSFSTIDRAGLLMEAHQKLEHSIRMSCCRGMQMAILNADLYPHTVSMELVLIDGSGVAQSLGFAPVASEPVLRAEETEPVPETLDFRFPASSRLEAFEEIKVVFHRSVARLHRSARISIERFTLTPRG